MADDESTQCPTQQFQSLSVAAPESSSSAGMSIEERFAIIRSVGEECIQETELMQLLKFKDEPICYDGFEPSGQMHIAQGVMKVINVNKLVSAGCRVKIWIADLFAKLNKKLGGDMKKIQDVGKYFIETWKAAGMDIDSGVVKLWVVKTLMIYLVLRSCMLACNVQIFFSLRRTFACLVWTSARSMCLLGSIVMISKENTNPSFYHTICFRACSKGKKKMSKSIPSSAVYMDDSEADVNAKIKKAYCPPKIVENNPCLEYVKYIALPWFKEFTVERKVEYGGPKTYKTFEELASDYEAEALHPGDTKPALAKALNMILQPVRDHFVNDDNARTLLKRIKTYKVTR